MRTTLKTLARRTGLALVSTTLIATSAQAQVYATMYPNYPGGFSNPSQPFQGGTPLCKADIGATWQGFTLLFTNATTRSNICGANANRINPAFWRFGARITGQIWASHTGTYTMDFSADDGQILTINGTIFDNEWNLIKGGGPGVVDVNLIQGINNFNIDYNNSFTGGGFVRMHSLEPDVMFVTPEPASMAMMATGLFAMAGLAWRRKRSAAV